MQNNRSLFVLAFLFILETQSLNASQKLSISPLSLYVITKYTPNNSAQKNDCDIAPPTRKGDFKDRKRIVPQSSLDAKQVESIKNEYPFLIAQPKKDLFNSDQESELNSFKPTKTTDFHQPTTKDFVRNVCISPKLSPTQRSTGY